MKLMIDSIDYTCALDAAEPLTVERALNAPSQCRFALSLPADGSLAVPAHMQPVQVSADDGTLLFTGYLAGAPLPAYAGLATEGPRCRLRVEALSDEVLLDALLPADRTTAAGLSAGALVASLAARTGSAALNAEALTLNSPVNEFVAAPGASFSASAGRVATQVRAAYRASGGKLQLAAIPARVHALAERDGTLSPARLARTSGARRAAANDVTVFGELEPAAYVTEFFQGDGVTAQFTLGARPFAMPASEVVLIDDDFTHLNLEMWQGVTDGNFSLGDGGLQLSGGSGTDGSTQCAWRDPVEMNGTLLLEADGVALAQGSTGVLAGFYAGGKTTSACVAGFSIAAAQGTGALTLQPLVKGVATGTPFAITTDVGTQYTLRLRVHCDEHERARATYVGFGDSGAVAFGGDTVNAPGSLLFEVQPCVNGVLGMPVVLYDGAVEALPSACSVVAASSVNLAGSLRALRLHQLGSSWVTSTPAGGTSRTRRVGSLVESAECALDSSGRLTFYAGFLPAVGEQIVVRYRAAARAAGRASSGAAGVTSRWIGSLRRPRARSSADCRNAAAALLATATSTSALWSGTYHATQYELDADVWPGDALAVDAPSCGLAGQVVVRAARLTVHATVPDLVEYGITFANDWAEDLAIHTTASVPSDAVVPAQRIAVFAPSVRAMTATVTGSSIVLDMGMDAPTGGGFEVRRREDAFVQGNDPGVAARGTQRTLTVARTAAQERYFVRAFDGATPRNYSEFSAAVFVNVPIGQ